MVSLPTGGYLFRAMLVLRPLRAGAAGRRSVDWPELDAFRRSTGLIEKGHDAEVLYGMCEAFFTGYIAGENPMGIEPMSRAD